MLAVRVSVFILPSKLAMIGAKPAAKAGANHAAGQGPCQAVFSIKLDKKKYWRRRAQL